MVFQIEQAEFDYLPNIYLIIVDLKVINSFQHFHYKKVTNIYKVRVPLNLHVWRTRLFPVAQMAHMTMFPLWYTSLLAYVYIWFLGRMRGYCIIELKRFVLN